MHLHALGDRQLRGQVRRTAESVQAEPSTRRHCGAPQGAVTDDARAQQRCGGHVVELLRHAVGVPLVDQQVFGVATIVVPAGVAGRPAQVLASGTAVATAAAGAAQPGHPDPVAELEAGRRPGGRRFAVRHHPADHLVPGGDVRTALRQVTLADVQAGAADSAGGDLHQHFTGAGCGYGHLR